VKSSRLIIQTFQIYYSFTGWRHIAQFKLMSLWMSQKICTGCKHNRVYLLNTVALFWMKLWEKLIGLDFS